MPEIELTVMAHGPDPLGILKPVLERFEAEYQTRVQVRVLTWATAWQEMVKIALYSHGPDVSVIGSTWMASLAGMNALRPFTSDEIKAMGGPSAFLSQAWQSASLTGDDRIFAVPWMADTRVVHYRRDLLRQADIDEETAFQTPERLDQTLSRLQSSGVRIPWAAPTRHSLNTLHNAATWVWGAGGSLVSPDGRRTLFNQPEARAGIQAYFALYRYLAPAARDLDPEQSSELFAQGRAAVILTGPWLFNRIWTRSEFVAPEVIDNLGIALPPGTPFLGGTNLTVWRHTRHEQEAVALISFLTGEEFQSRSVQQIGLLPVRLDVLSSPPFATDPAYQVLSRALKAGRSFYPISLWGLVEDKLATTLTQIGAEVLANPNLDLRETINRELDQLASRLDHTLAQRGKV